MPKRKQPAEGQSPLFEGDPSRHMRTWQEIEESQPGYPVTHGPKGSYVDASSRAENLTEALDAFSRRNQRLGFDVAANTRAYSGPIWERYTFMTPVVMEGAQKNVDVFLQQAKEGFWKATGFSAMRGLGVMTDAEIDARARKMWREFAEKYGDPNKRKVRNKYKKQLHKAIRSDGSGELAA